MSSVSAFRDLTGLTAILKACLAAYLVVSLIGLWSGWGELQLLQSAMAGAEITEAEATASDTRQAMAGLLYALVFIVTGVVFLRWIVIANRNARALGASGMQFTPGWSAGWYFVPIACLWKPYQAMTELFRASHPDFTDDWANAPRPGILPVWWTLWVVSTFVDSIALRLIFRAETLEQLVSMSLAKLLSGALYIPLGIVALVLVSRLSALQAEKHARLRVAAS
jgi:uncharacterized membrane protein